MSEPLQRDKINFSKHETIAPAPSLPRVADQSSNRRPRRCQSFFPPCESGSCACGRGYIFLGQRNRLAMGTELSIESGSLPALRLCQAAGLTWRSGIPQWLPRAEMASLPGLAVRVLEAVLLVALWLSAQAYLIMLYGSAAIVLIGLVASSTRQIRQFAAPSSRDRTSWLASISRFCRFVLRSGPSPARLSRRSRAVPAARSRNEESL